MSLVDVLEAAIRRAEEATPGPWRALDEDGHPFAGGGFLFVLDAEARSVAQVLIQSNHSSPDEQAHQAFIASLSPDVAIALYRVALAAQVVLDEAVGWPEERVISTTHHPYQAERYSALSVSLEALSQVMDR